MIRRIPLATVGLCLALSLGACSSMIPKAPEYGGADTVDAVPDDAFVGQWRMIALNPADDEVPPERTITYAANGTFRAEIVPTPDMAETMGDTPILMSGNWRIENGNLVHDSTELDMQRDDLISRMAASIMRSRPPITARGNVYELSNDRIVVLSEEGYANAFERL